MLTLYTDLTGCIRQASEHACELFGTAPERLVSRKLPLFFVENRHRVIEMMEAAAGGLSMQVPTVLQALKGPRRRVLIEIHRIGSVHQDLLEWVVRPLDVEPSGC